MPTPEEKAREKIDDMLKQSGWVIQDRNQLNITANIGVAVREFLMNNNREADYLLFVDGKACGVIEAKKIGTPLSAVENQSNGYAQNLPNYATHWQLPLPFIYETTGEETYFTDIRDINARSRKVFSFHKPETLFSWLSVNDTLRNRLKNLPTLDSIGLRRCQQEAIIELEKSFSQNNPRSLICMATGSGKTYTACNFVYRLLKYGKAKRILFLVDRNNLGRQTKKEFENFVLKDENRKFSEVYIVSHQQTNTIDKNAKVVITTIQRLYSMLRGETEYNGENEEISSFELGTTGRPKEVVYNPTIPPEYFDFIITDECHRSIYGDWRQVLEYFDSFLIGLTATPSKQTLGYFNQNLVSDYPYEKSVADGVNVDYQVLRIKTEVSENGGKIDKNFEVPVRDRKTRKIFYESIDEDLEYKKNDLDRSVVVPNQIRTIIECYKNSIFTELFPNREKTFIPKTLIFAKDDNHAEEIVRITREVFNKDNDFCKKITYRVSGVKPEELIKEFQTSPKFRIAVTVDMIATGTDIKPLEVLIFMRDVHSSIYYEQMKGRGCRTINETDLKSATPNSNGKSLFYIIDAVGVTESTKTTSKPLERKRTVPLKTLLEHIAVGDRNDDTLSSIAGRLVNIDRKFEDEDKKRITKYTNDKSLTQLAGEILDTTEEDFIEIHTAEEIKNIQDKILEPFNKPEFRQELLELSIKSGLYIDNLTTDKVITVDMNKEKASSTIKSFKQFIEDNKDEITAISIIYNQSYQKRNLSYDNIVELYDKLKLSHLEPDKVWNAYAIVENDKVQRVSNPQKLLTNIIQLVRFSLKQIERLESFDRVASAKYELWFGRQKKLGITFTAEQKLWLDRIKDCIISNACITAENIQNLLADKGGILKMRQLFKDKTDNILSELSLALVA